MCAAETASKRRSTAAVVGMVLIGSFLVGGLIVFADYHAVAPNGSGTLLFAVLFLGIPFLISVAAIPISLFFCISSKRQRSAFQVLISSLIFAVVFIVSVNIGGRVRMNGFHALAQRSIPLVEAIKAYEQKHGNPPPTLNDIVPDFLPSIPETGMGSYPQYRYYVGKKDRYHGNPWILEVFTPSALINFDVFVYAPKQNYDSWCGDPFERVGDWAYLHE